MLNEWYIPNREWYWLNTLNFALDLSTLTPKKWHTYIKSMVSHHTKSKQIYSILPSLTMLKYGTYFVFSSSFHSTSEINTKWKFGLFNRDFFFSFWHAFCEDMRVFTMNVMWTKSLYVRRSDRNWKKCLNYKSQMLCTVATMLIM